MDQKETDLRRLSPEALAQLGAPKVVYIRALRPEDVPPEVRGVENLPVGIMLYSVHAADGTQMAIVDDRASAFAGALEHDFEPVSVH